MQWRKAWNHLARTARLMVGVPDYDYYVAHRQEAHPGEPVMSRSEFLRERTERRFGGGPGRIGRCC
jgi:uncharacterized short protein YbdD (DUF466 family)